MKTILLYYKHKQNEHSLTKQVGSLQNLLLMTIIQNYFGWLYSIAKRNSLSIVKILVSVLCLIKSMLVNKCTVKQRVMKGQLSVC